MNSGMPKRFDAPEWVLAQDIDIWLFETFGQPDEIDPDQTKLPLKSKLPLNCEDLYAKFFGVF